MHHNCTDETCLCNVTGLVPLHAVACTGCPRGFCTTHPVYKHGHCACCTMGEVMEEEDAWGVAPSAENAEYGIGDVEAFICAFFQDGLSINNAYYFLNKVYHADIDWHCNYADHIYDALRTGRCYARELYFEVGPERYCQLLNNLSNARVLREHNALRTSESETLRDWGR